jgi:hypothetical protein
MVEFWLLVYASKHDLPLQQVNNDFVATNSQKSNINHLFHYHSKGKRSDGGDILRI